MSQVEWNSARLSDARPVQVEGGTGADWSAAGAETASYNPVPHRSRLAGVVKPIHRTDQ